MITTHVLDISAGRPAAGIRVTLSRMDDGRRSTLGSGVTDGDGRIRELSGSEKVGAGTYELTFETGAYFRERGVEALHPRVVLVIDVANDAQHYHVPLLLSPFGYTTYRGS